MGIIDTTGGLHRVTGRSRSGGAEVEWSCVLKVIVRPGNDEGLDPASWCHWRREAAFYGSSLGSAVRLRAPRPYLVLEDGDRARVWMEHVDAETREWELEDFGRAARVAGENAGEFLAGRALPGEPWLSRAFLRSFLADDIPVVEAVAFPAFEDGLRAAGDGEHGLVRAGYAGAVALRIAACLPGWAAFMLGPERVQGTERLFRRPAEAILERWIALTDVCLDLADEAAVSSRR